MFLSSEILKKRGHVGLHEAPDALLSADALFRWDTICLSLLRCISVGFAASQVMHASNSWSCIRGVLMHRCANSCSHGYGPCFSRVSPFAALVETCLVALPECGIAPFCFLSAATRDLLGAMPSVRLPFRFSFVNSLLHMSQCWLRVTSVAVKTCCVVYRKKA